MKKLNIIRKAIDSKTLLYLLKNEVLSTIESFMKEIKKGLDFREFSSNFYILRTDLEDLRDKVKKEGVTSNSSEENVVQGKTISDSKRILQELRTLFQLPVKDIIREIEAGTLTDQQIYNYLDRLADTAKIWERKTEW